MIDTYDGFAYGFTSPDINSAGGKRRRQILVVAKNMADANAIIHHLKPDAQYEERGQHILELARARGCPDDDGIGYDPNA